MAFDFLGKALQERKQQGNLRSRTCVDYERDAVIAVNGQHYINFASNDYLGLRHNQQVLQAWVQGLAQFGGGSGASPLVTGYSLAHRELENTLAEQLNREAVLLFNSGFAANQAICQALFNEPGIILADKLMHASFIDGALASAASLKRFAHNDHAHLKVLLDSHPHAHRIIASEGVFSMDGDVARVQELACIASAANTWFMLDDAHGFGVLGERGLGSVELHNLHQSQCQIVMGTFGKALGTGGAFVAGSHALIAHLVNFSRHYIYSTAMPPAQAMATMEALNLVIQGEQRESLHSNIEYFKRQAASTDLQLINSDSAIQPVIVHTPQRAMSYAAELAKRGLWVPAIRYPTVPKGTERLRITLSATHSQRDIDALIDGLQLAREVIVSDDQ